MDDLDPIDLVPWKAPPAPPATDPRFWTNVERFESEAWNAPGAEKGWVDRLEVRWQAMLDSFVCERPPLDARSRLFTELRTGRVRYLVIGVGGADMHARGHGTHLHTEDLDLFLPPDPANLLSAWSACERAGYGLWTRYEPLDEPRDEWLARRVVSRRALTTARAPDALPTDLTVVMGAFDFEDVWLRRIESHVPGAGVDLARFSDIVEAKRHAGREKDRRFLAEQRDLVARMLAEERPPGRRP